MKNFSFIFLRGIVKKRKILYIVVFSFFILFLFDWKKVFADISGIPQVFQVSAYYSPILHQKQYVSGGYEEDIKMNGNGIYGADGTPVYIGMISAPAKYKFGTQIYIPGLGIGTVHDRGGAIFSSKGYDRIDIWMGRGDEGRIRAIRWGTKKVKGIILDKKIQNTLHISTEEISRIYKKDSLISNNKKKEEKERDTKEKCISREEKRNVYFYTRNLEREDENEEVKKVQEFLKHQGIFKGETTYFFGPKTEDAVYIFQKRYNIVKSKESIGAGIWGPKTRKKANEILEKERDTKEKCISREEKRNVYFYTRNLEREDKNEEVKKVQEFLKHQGIFKGETTYFFGSKTEDAVYIFQKRYNIVKSKESIGAGIWGPKTRKKANEILMLY